MIEADLYAVLKNVAATYPAGGVPDAPALPYCTYHRINGAPENTFARVPARTKVRIQVDAVAQDYAGAKTLAAAVQMAMQSAPFANWLDSDRDAPLDETKQARVSMDFFAWQ